MHSDLPPAPATPSPFCGLLCIRKLCKIVAKFQFPPPKKKKRIETEGGKDDGNAKRRDELKCGKK